MQHRSHELEVPGQQRKLQYRWAEQRDTDWSIAAGVSYSQTLVDHDYGSLLRCVDITRLLQVQLVLSSMLKGCVLDGVASCPPRQSQKQRQELGGHPAGLEAHSLSHHRRLYRLTATCQHKQQKDSLQAPLAGNKQAGMQLAMSQAMEHVAGQHAQLTMPSDMTSRILAGFRLQTTTTRRFCICSRGTHLTRPLTTCRQNLYFRLGRHSQGGSLLSLLSLGSGTLLQHCCSAAPAADNPSPPVLTPVLCSASKPGPAAAAAATGLNSSHLHSTTCCS